MATKTPSRVAVIGCGWWSQGWHLPHLAANAPHVVIAAIVDPSPLPISTLSSSPLLSLVELSKKYNNCPHYNSVEEMLADPEVGPTLDGAIVATSHASHFQVGMALLKEGVHRRSMAEAIEKEQGGSDSVVDAGKKRSRPQSIHRALHILMEKPMTCSVDEALEMSKMSMTYPEGAFVINHTASYRPQTFVAKEIISSGQLGEIRHITATMNGGLMWLFDDKKNESWVSKTPWQKGEDSKTPMNGNGYAWGQLAHILAWIYAVLGADDVAVPKKVFCTMTHAPNTGADISLAAVITCSDGITFSISGTALLPGSQYADPPIGKRINVEIFGMKGCLLWGGDDRIPETGKLELRRSAPGKKEDGQSEFPCSQGDAANELKDGFYFEDGVQDGKGPGSMKVFLDACNSSAAKSLAFESDESTAILVDESEPTPLANDSLIGLRTVQIIDAMYKSSISGNAVDVQ
mmetsp:Transcript_25286/g.42938  ORF Transcript_25286/g.42938 Transcript_25286/m.42938 type:complete len:462 (-) Transcript_25286:78-1463(-)